MSDDILLISIPAAQTLTSLGRTTIYDLMDTGEIRSVKVGRRRLIVKASIDDLVERLTIASDGLRA